MDTNLKLSESLNKYLPQELATKFISEFNTEYTSNLPNESLTELIKKYGDCLSHKLQVDAQKFELTDEDLENFNNFIKDLNSKINELNKYPPANFIWCGPVTVDGVSTMGAKSLNDQFSEQEIIFWALDEHVYSFKEEFKGRDNIRVLSIESYCQLMNLTLEEYDDHTKLTLLEAIEARKFAAASSKINQRAKAREYTTITDYIKNTISIFNGGFILDANLIVTPTNKEDKRLMIPYEQNTAVSRDDDKSDEIVKKSKHIDVWFLYYSKKNCIKPENLKLNDIPKDNTLQVRLYHSMIKLAIPNEKFSQEKSEHEFFKYNHEYQTILCETESYNSLKKNDNFKELREYSSKLSRLYGTAIVKSATDKTDSFIQYSYFSKEKKSITSTSREIIRLSSRNKSEDRVNFIMFKRFNNSHVLDVLAEPNHCKDFKTLSNEAFYFYAKYHPKYMDELPMEVFKSFFDIDSDKYEFDHEKYGIWRRAYPNAIYKLVEKIDKLEQDIQNIQQQLDSNLSNEATGNLMLELNKLNIYKDMLSSFKNLSEDDNDFDIEADLEYEVNSFAAILDEYVNRYKVNYFKDNDLFAKNSFEIIKKFMEYETNYYDIFPPTFLNLFSELNLYQSFIENLKPLNSCDRLEFIYQSIKRGKLSLFLDNQQNLISFLEKFKNDITELLTSDYQKEINNDAIKPTLYMDILVETMLFHEVLDKLPLTDEQYNKIIEYIEDEDLIKRLSNKISRSSTILVTSYSNMDTKSERESSHDSEKEISRPKTNK